MLYDTKREDRLGRDHQEEFTGYTAKAGVLFNSRRHFTMDLEYRYHWSYAVEDSMLIGSVGYNLPRASTAAANASSDPSIAALR